MAVMLPTVPQIDVLNLLYEQYRLYTTDLGRTHEGLGKLYKKLTKLDKKLDELDGQPWSREQRRKLSWSRSVAKQSIANLVARQAEIFSLLQQCRDLIASYNLNAHATPLTPCTTYLPASPYGMQAVMTPYPHTPWTAGSFQAPMSGQPQYWDLSMLYDNGGMSRSNSSVDNTGPDQVIDFQHTDVGDEQYPHHIYCHELMGTVPEEPSESAVEDKESLAPHLGGMRATPRAASVITIDTEKANEIHKRRYSENVARNGMHTHHAQAGLAGARRGRIDMVRAKTAPELHLQTHTVEEER